MEITELKADNFQAWIIAHDEFKTKTKSTDKANKAHPKDNENYDIIKGSVKDNKDETHAVILHVFVKLSEIIITCFLISTVYYTRWGLIWLLVNCLLTVVMMWLYIKVKKWLINRLENIYLIRLIHFLAICFSFACIFIARHLVMEDDQKTEYLAIDYK